MSHFAGGNLPSTFGPQGYQSATANNQAATGAGATEGTNKLTYVAPITGFYRVTCALRIVTVSTAGTSHSVKGQVAYTSVTGTATAAVDIKNSNTAVTAFDVKGGAAGDMQTQTGVIKAVAGTNITLTSLDTVSGTGTGTTEVTFVVEGLGPA